MATQQQTTDASAQAAAGAAPAGDIVSVAPAKADLGKRFLAALVDTGITIVMGFLPVIGWIAGAAYWLVRDGLDLEFMDHRSVGKKLLGLRPITLDGSPMDLVASAKRNWTLALGGVASFLLVIPILGWIAAIPVALVALVVGIAEIVLVVTDSRGRRIGDRTGNSQVVAAD